MGQAVIFHHVRIVCGAAAAIEVAVTDEHLVVDVAFEFVDERTVVGACVDEFHKLGRDADVESDRLVAKHCPAQRIAPFLPLQKKILQLLRRQRVGDLVRLRRLPTLAGTAKQDAGLATVQRAVVAGEDQRLADIGRGTGSGLLGQRNGSSQR
jgi:hypothetical protein